MNIKYVRFVWIICLGWVATACVGVGLDEPTKAFDSQSQAIMSGTSTFSRDGVGFISIALSDGTFGGCTATMVGTQHFVTAAHCIEYAVEARATQNVIRFQRSASSPIVTLNIDSVWSYHTSPGRYDIAVGMLSPGLTWNVGESLAPRLPSTGSTKTAVGFGCNRWVDLNGNGNALIDGDLDENEFFGGGIKRFETYTGWETNLCAGDSGGPLFEGTLNGGGKMAYVASANGRDFWSNLYAEIPVVREWIYAKMRQSFLNMEVGINRSGHDYRSFSLSGSNDSINAKICQQTCTRESSCRAFTYVNSSHRCWLKKAEGEPVFANGMVSGLKEKSGSFSISGAAYSSASATNVEVCLGRCATDPQCKAYTMQGGICTLKRSVLANGVSCPTCLSGRKTLEEGVFRIGNLQRIASANDARECASICAKDTNCRSFTYSIGNRDCYVYSTQGVFHYSNPNMVSGIRHGLEADVDRPGGDYRSFVMSRPDPVLCQATCESESQCKSWTMTLKPFNGVNRCWLKSSIRPARTNVRGVISGIKGTSFF